MPENCGERRCEACKDERKERKEGYAEEVVEAEKPDEVPAQKGVARLWKLSVGASRKAASEDEKHLKP